MEKGRTYRSSEPTTLQCFAYHVRRASAPSMRKSAGVPPSARRTSRNVCPRRSHNAASASGSRSRLHERSDYVRVRRVSIAGDGRTKGGEKTHERGASDRLGTPVRAEREVFRAEVEPQVRARAGADVPIPRPPRVIVGGRR